MRLFSTSPLNWKTTGLFVGLATLCTGLLGLGIVAGRVPIQQMITLSDAERQFLKIWLGLAIALGLLLPTLAWGVWFKFPAARRVLGFYLVVLTLQIVTEQVLGGLWLPSLVVAIGTLYTAFRVWQLWQGRALIRSSRQMTAGARSLLNGLLWLLIGYWTCNLLMLAVLAWPSVA